MTRDPLTCVPETPLIEAARKMRDIHVSCIIAAEGRRGRGHPDDRRHHQPRSRRGAGAGDTRRAGHDGDPITLPPTALVADVLHTMVEKGITHMPVVETGKLVGILTQTDLTRFQATSSAALIQEIAAARTRRPLPRSCAAFPSFWCNWSRRRTRTRWSRA
jgi:CBS domain-containing protein